MPRYKLRFLGRNGQTTHVYSFDASDDEEAIKFAKVWREDAPLELWARFQMLQRWES